MANPQQLRGRIRSVENTRQITRTMEMVSTSKLKRAQDRVVATRPYAQALSDVIGDLYSPELAERFPLLRQPGDGAKCVALVLITSNRGLCGGFNSNLIKLARARIEQLEQQDVSVRLHLIGKKGIGYFKYIGQEIASAREDIGDKPTVEHAADVVQPLVEAFEREELDAVEVIFANFRSAMSTPPVNQRILPVEAPGARVNKSKSARAAGPVRVPNYILKPSAAEIVSSVLPMYVRNSMYRALVETVAAEHGARRTAMKSATDNAGDMIDSLRRVLNRARQAKITQEIAEIVGGADAS